MKFHSALDTLFKNIYLSCFIIISERKKKKVLLIWNVDGVTFCCISVRCNRQFDINHLFRKIYIYIYINKISIEDVVDGEEGSVPCLTNIACDVASFNDVYPEVWIRLVWPRYIPNRGSHSLLLWFTLLPGANTNLIRQLNFESGYTSTPTVEGIGYTRLYAV